MGPITVLLADDSEVVKKSIRRLLGEYPEEISLVGEADSFAQTIQMARQFKAADCTYGCPHEGRPNPGYDDRTRELLLMPFGHLRGD
jgi:hypothetical protein